MTSAASAAPHKRRHNPKELRGTLHAVRARIHEKRLVIRHKRAQIHRTRQYEHNAREELSVVQGRLHTTESSLRRTRARLSDLHEQQGILEERIVATQHRLDMRRRMLAMRVRQNYEHGNTTYMQVLLRSRDMHEYMSRSFYVQRMVESDVKLVADIKFDQKQLADDKRTLDAEAQEQAELKARREAETEQYRSDAQRKHVLLTELASQEAHQVSELQSEEEQLEAMEEESNNIAAEIRASMATPRGRVRMMHAWTGGFIRPAAGPITSGFGERFHPILRRYRMHTGIDIGAGYGSPIHAAAGGIVLSAGSRRGYGNCVIIDHGGGVSTLYGHCSVLLVSEGEQVHQGQVIARVGATGMATGPHLHFEVRHNGVPVNPR